MRTPKYTIAQVGDALDKANGINADAARILGLSRQAVSDYIKKSKKLQARKAAIVQERLDLAENKLHALIEQADGPSIRFYLKTQGKDRGYVERQEQTGPDGAPMVHIYMPDNGRDRPSGT